MEENNHERTSRNIMVARKIDSYIQDMRIVNKGMITETTKSRSDVYNEILGLGIEIHNLKKELGEKEFERIWSLLHKLDLNKIDISKLI